MAPSAGASGRGGGAATSLDEKKNAVKVWLKKMSLEQYSDGVVDFRYDSMDALLLRILDSVCVCCRKWKASKGKPCSNVS